MRECLEKYIIFISYAALKILQFSHKTQISLKK